MLQVNQFTVYVCDKFLKDYRVESKRVKLGVICDRILVPYALLISATNLYTAASTGSAVMTYDIDFSFSS